MIITTKCFHIIYFTKALKAKSSTYKLIQNTFIEKTSI